MSQKTLGAGLGHAYETFYSWRSMASRFPFTGQRDRLRWTVINTMIHKFSLPVAKQNRVVRDASSPPEGKFAEHVLPGAALTRGRNEGGEKNKEDAIGKGAFV